MSHWLEDAERNATGRKLSDKEERIRQKMLRVQENYTGVKAQYDEFISGLYTLVNRANTLPGERRKLFGMIDARPRSSKLDNQLNILSSSRKLEPRKLFGFLPPLFPAQMRMVRAVFISVSDKPGMISIEFKEKRTRKRRDNGIHEHYRGGIHVLYSFKAESLSRELSLEIIDWLAFSTELKDLTYIQSHTGKTRIINTD
jgi:hypothetical protein